MESKISVNKECYVCHRYDVEDHHIFFGVANRKHSEKYGMKVWLCPEHHRGTNGVHGKNGHELDMVLKKIAQNVFEQDHTRDEFRRIFGKSFL